MLTNGSLLRSLHIAVPCLGLKVIDKIKMGMVTSRALWMDPDVRPDYQTEPIFDAHYGFTKKRIPRSRFSF